MYIFTILLNHRGFHRYTDMYIQIKLVKGLSLLVAIHCMFLFMQCVCACIHVYARVCVCVCSSPALAVGVSVIISTSVAMETISVTLIGFITRRVGTCWTGRETEKNWGRNERKREKDRVKVGGHEKSFSRVKSGNPEICRRDVRDSQRTRMEAEKKCSFPSQIFRK